jgi:hypothetical protein
MDDASA